MAIALHPATAADLDLLQYWDEQPHVVNSDPNDDRGWEVEINRSPDWWGWLLCLPITSRRLVSD